MYSEPDLWHALLGRIAAIAGQFLRLQVEAGASAIQLFDSWAGALSLADYETYVKPHSAAVLASVADLDVPRIHFGVGTGELLHAMGDAGADVVGVDWRVPLDEAVRRIGPGKAVQGNLDPTAVFAPTEFVHARAAEIIDAGRPPTATCSTSVMASCRRLTPTRWRASSTSSTATSRPSPDMRVAVVGGGMSGLAAAYELAIGGAEVDRARGIGPSRRQAEARHGRRPDARPRCGVDARPPARGARPRAMPLVWTTQVVNPRTITASIWTHGALRPMPPTVMGIPADVEALEASGIANVDPHVVPVPDDDVSVA